MHSIGAGSFGGFDGAMLYAIVKTFSPRRIIEIGSGRSTLISLAALKKSGHPFSFTAIEPHPRSYIRDLREIKLIETKVENVPLEMFAQLEENDILFIDSSHAVRIDGDVLFEILEILPRLNRGVLVHIHDIFLPKHYPKHWTLEEHRFWTEQYLVQAFLFNSEFIITWSSGIMAHEQAALTKQHIPNFD